MWPALIAFAWLVNPVVDLEEKVDDFVLETKRIEIPGFPQAFNPSIVRFDGKLLMSFRVIPDPKTPFTSWIGLIWLNDQFLPIGKPQQLRTRRAASSVPSRAEDARLFTIGGHLYISYADNPEPKLSKGGFRMYVAELIWNGQEMVADSIERLAIFNGETESLREKNWVPFDYRGNLLLAYSLNPHLIFCPFLDTESCLTVASTEADIQWDWGDLRGGTPGLQDPVTGDYLAFFHSSKKVSSVQSDGKNIGHYFLGAYTFSSEPPFHITRVSPKPIIGKGFYSKTDYKPYWTQLKVIFPGGFFMEKECIWIAYGKDDHEIWIAKLGYQGLFKSLVPVF
jgi:predicted GH43/DUF377 family glycosyl hydrolase